MAEAKGVMLSAWMIFLKNRYGEKKVAAAVAALPSKDARLVSASFLPSSWYAYESMAAMSDLTKRLISHIDGDISIQIGRFVAEHAYTGVYRSMVADDPVKQLEKFSWTDELIFRDTRKLETEVTGKVSCVVRYVGLEKPPSRGVCASQMGFWSRMLELAGASGVKAVHPKCRIIGGDCCEFSFQWNRN